MHHKHPLKVLLPPQPCTSYCRILLMRRPLVWSASWATTMAASRGPSGSVDALPTAAGRAKVWSCLGGAVVIATSTMQKIIEHHAIHWSYSSDRWTKSWIRSMLRRASRWHCLWANRQTSKNPTCQVGIHVDAASGGFIAPFQVVVLSGLDQDIPRISSSLFFSWGCEIWVLVVSRLCWWNPLLNFYQEGLPPWDFRLKNVLPLGLLWKTVLAGRVSVGCTSD